MGVLANRLERMGKHWRKWARKRSITCYRLYDRDIPDYPFIIDWYETRAVVSALERPKDDSEETRERWIREGLEEIRTGLALEADQVVLKERRRQTGGQQHEKQEDSRDETVVHEGGHRFLVNLTDYLDTGLFLDHRITRELVGEMAEGGRFLNLFAYTGSFTVYAAAGGAVATDTLDISNTYLDWAHRNFQLNGLDPVRHRLERADCLRWLPDAARQRREYDLIVCDPPTFSTSKKMTGVFDVGEAHPELINGCLRLLAPGGSLFFSSNSRSFRMKEDELSPCTLEEISHVTVPEDFRNKKIHHCWRITHPQT